MCEFSNIFTSYNLNDIEIGIVCALALTSIDSLGLKMYQFIFNINNNIKEALKLEIKRKTDNLGNYKSFSLF